MFHSKVSKIALLVALGFSANAFAETVEEPCVIASFEGDPLNNYANGTCIFDVDPSTGDGTWIDFNSSTDNTNINENDNSNSVLVELGGQSVSNNLRMGDQITNQTFQDLVGDITLSNGNTLSDLATATANAGVDNAGNSAINQRVEGSRSYSYSYGRSSAATPNFETQKTFELDVGPLGRWAYTNFDEDAAAFKEKMIRLDNELQLAMLPEKRIALAMEFMRDNQCDTAKLRSSNKEIFLGCEIVGEYLSVVLLGDPEFLKQREEKFFADLEYRGLKESSLEANKYKKQSAALKFNQRFAGLNAERLAFEGATASVESCGPIAKNILVKAAIQWQANSCSSTEDSVACADAGRLFARHDLAMNATDASCGAEEIITDAMIGNVTTKDICKLDVNGEDFTMTGEQKLAYAQACANPDYTVNQDGQEVVVAERRQLANF